MKIADIDVEELEQWAAEASMRGAGVELHVLAQRWELRAVTDRDDDSAPLEPLGIEHAGERPRGKIA